MTTRRREVFRRRKSSADSGKRSPSKKSKASPTNNSVIADKQPLNPEHPSTAASTGMATEQVPLLEGKMPRIPPAPFARALSRPNGTRLPQTIAHRGYKAVFPENTIAAFQGAVKIGAHALETDLHLSKDKVVVLSHDPTLKRCFGDEKKIADCDWSYLSEIRTLKEPKQPMPRLVDLLEYLSQPELQHVWVLFDIKTDDDAEELLDITAKTIASVPSERPWKDRIVMGAWNENYVSLVQEYLPGFHVAYIGASLIYAKRFLKDPGVDFNILQQVLVGPIGNRFLRKVQEAGRNLYVWTVNDEGWMEWSIQHSVDGVITDDPKLFLEVCERWETSGSDSRIRTSGWGRAKLFAQAAIIQILSIFFTLLYFRRLVLRGKRKLPSMRAT